MPERSKPVTTFRAVQEALPVLNQGINHTETIALHITFVGHLAPWTTFVANQSYFSFPSQMLRYLRSTVSSINRLNLSTSVNMSLLAFHANAPWNLICSLLNFRILGYSLLFYIISHLDSIIPEHCLYYNLIPNIHCK
jgi:hypothetical protein